MKHELAVIGADGEDKQSAATLGSLTESQQQKRKDLKEVRRKVFRRLKGLLKVFAVARSYKVG